MIRASLIAAAAGAAVMGLEILTSRWLAPAFGFTLTTWAWVISVTLAAGATGAFLGGRVARRERRGKIVATLLAVAAVAILIESFVAPGLADAWLEWPVVWGAGVGALVLLGVPLVALGGIVPLLIAQTEEEPGSAASRAGTLIAASTLGSLVGTLGVALFCVPSLGLATTARCAAALLGLAAIGAARAPRALLALLVVSVIVGPGERPPDRPDHVVRETPYGRLEFRADESGGFSLFVNGINQATGSLAFAGRGSLLSRGQYLELLPYLRPDARTALQIGLGGALVPSVLASYGIEVASVDVDADLVAIVRDRIGYEGEVTIADGRRALRLETRRFDLIILDVFQGESVPSHLMTREAFEDARARLTDGGVLAIHLIGAPDHVVTGAVARTLREVFPKTLAVRERPGTGLQHLVLFASDAPLPVFPDADLLAFGWLGNERFDPPVDGAPILTDDLNPLERLNEEPARALRRASRPSASSRSSE